MNLDSYKYVVESDLEEEEQTLSPRAAVIAQLFEFRESDRTRGIVITGFTLLLTGWLLTNFAAIPLLLAQSAENAWMNPLLRWCPENGYDVAKWVLFGITAVFMSLGMAMICSQRFHPSLLAMHVLVPLSLVPLLAGYLFRWSCRTIPVAIQMWAGISSFLMISSMVCVLSELSGNQSSWWIVLLTFQMQFAGSMVIMSVFHMLQQVLLAKVAPSVDLPGSRVTPQTG